MSASQGPEDTLGRGRSVMFVIFEEAPRRERMPGRWGRADVRLGVEKWGSSA